MTTMTLWQLYLIGLALSIPLHWLHRDHDHAATIRLHDTDPWMLLDYELEMVHILRAQQDNAKYRLQQTLFTLAVAGAWPVFWPVFAYGYVRRIWLRYMHLKSMAYQFYLLMRSEATAESDANDDAPPFEAGPR